MNATAPRRGNLKRSKHERGDLRRKLLIDATTRLLNVTPVDKIRLSDIAREADIPLASARHFYKDKHEALFAVITAAHVDWFTILLDHVRKVAPQSWQELSDALVDATLLFWERHPVVMKILRGAASGRLSQAESQSDRTYSAPYIHQLFDAFFEIPSLPGDAPDVFLIYTTLTDSVFSIAITEGEFPTPRIIDEAKAVGRNYLSLYLPNYLPARTPPVAIQIPSIDL